LAAWLDKSDDASSKRSYQQECFCVEKVLPCHSVREQADVTIYNNKQEKNNAKTAGQQNSNDTYMLSMSQKTFSLTSNNTIMLFDLPASTNVGVTDLVIFTFDPLVPKRTSFSTTPVTVILLAQ